MTQENFNLATFYSSPLGLIVIMNKLSDEFAASIDFLLFCFSMLMTALSLAFLFTHDGSKRFD